MITTAQFRHAKSNPPELSAMLASGSVGVTDTPFTTEISMAETNFAMFDVLDPNGVLLSREQPLDPEYWFESGKLKVKRSGVHTLRVYTDIMAFESRQFAVGKKIVMSDGSLFKVGVPFWPQILNQPEHGIARVSNDGRAIAYVSQGFTGQVAFAYRMVNVFGQVSEPACVNVTVI